MIVQLKNTELVLVAESDAESYYLKHFFSTNWAQVAVDAIFGEDVNRVYIKPIEQLKN